MLAEQLIDRFFEKDAFAVVLFDDASRRFAFTESIDLELIFGSLVCFDLRVFEFFRCKFHCELYIVVFS